MVTVPTVRVDGLDLYYEEYGAGPPVLGIHGTPSSAVLWSAAARRLGEHGRCIVYERRGFGRSAAPEPFTSTDLDDQVADALGLLRALAAVPAVLVGRSTGGLVALALAHQHPGSVRGLVLLEPAAFGLDDEAAATAAEVRRRVLAHAADDPVRAAEAVFRVALGDEVWESLPPDLADLLAAASPAVLAEMHGRGLDLSAEPFTLDDADLARLDLPTLLVTAEDSVDALRRVNDRLARALPRAETVLVPGGHLIDPAHPAVLDFLDRFSAG